jgi:2-oxoisovalerate dehydrogenase E1 component
VPLADALGSGMGRAGGYSDGRDIGVVFNYPNPNGCPALPMSGGVGAQYTPTAGWAQAIRYHREGARGSRLERGDRTRARRRRLGGDQRLLVGADHRHHPEAADALLHRGQSIRHLGAVDLPDAGRRTSPATFPASPISGSSRGDGTDPVEAARLVDEAVDYVRAGDGPAMLRLEVPRLQGHSFQDTQTYKSEEFVRSEWARDPLPKLKAHLVGAVMDETEWDAITARGAGGGRGGARRSRSARHRRSGNGDGARRL